MPIFLKSQIKNSHRLRHKQTNGLKSKQETERTNKSSGQIKIKKGSLKKENFLLSMIILLEGSIDRSIFFFFEADPPLEIFEDQLHRQGNGLKSFRKMHLLQRGRKYTHENFYSFLIVGKLLKYRCPL